MTGKELRLAPNRMKIDKDDLMKLYSLLKDNDEAKNIIENVISFNQKRNDPRVKKSSSKVKSRCAPKMIKKMAEKARINLIDKQTSQETIFMKHLDSCGIDYKFQEIFYILKNERKFFVIDFIIKSKNVAIEIDGSHHYSGNQLFLDKERDMLMSKMFGIKVLRIKNKDVEDSVKCLEFIGRNLL